MAQSVTHIAAEYSNMACLRNGSSLLNNNNLSSFKYNILKYDEARSNMWSNSSHINSFLNKSCQLPFRSNNPTKDKPISDHIFKEHIHTTQSDEISDKNNPQEHFDERKSENEDADSTMCFQEDYTSSDCRNTPTLNTGHKANETVRSKEHKRLICEKKPLEETTLTSNKKNVQIADTFDNDGSYQHELPTDSSSASYHEYDANEPSHHARRPMNAFLIFCKRHRTVVKNRYPHLENRAVTKILGEWWAALETEEKASYTELAKQYKNAFFSANPNFKWYKLPAPPLRTLNTRPGNIVKASPQKQDVEMEEKPQQLFTPGKLADETQLGSITSLINSDNQHTNTYTVKSDPPTTNVTATSDTDEVTDHTELSPKSGEYKNYLLSPPVSTAKVSQPLKPFKKRMLHSPKDNKSIVRSIFGESDTSEKRIFDSSLLELALEDFVETVENESINNQEDDEEEEDLVRKQYALNTNSNLTQQELINKVVDHICSSRNDSVDSNSGDKDEYDCNICLQNQGTKFKETRKSVRSCKGLRYAKFMAEGKLFVNKRMKKQMSTGKIPKPSQTTHLNAIDKVPRTNDSIELNETIKKLTERTVGNTAKGVSNTDESADYMEQMNPEHSAQFMYDDARVDNVKKLFKAADFNLDEKIEALPSLSLDKFQQKKRESKKRKFLRATKHKDTTSMEYNKIQTDTHKTETNNDNNNKYMTSLTGSRKRKPRKQSITRLDPLNDAKQNATTPATTSSATNIDLFGLATLAEVAAKKAKIDQQQQQQQ